MEIERASAKFFQDFHGEIEAWLREVVASGIPIDELYIRVRQGDDQLHEICRGEMAPVGEIDTGEVLCRVWIEWDRERLTGKVRSEPVDIRPDSAMAK
jgi:hypothetical protein